ncbi:hypothetical protein I0Q12_02500 [Rhodococcus sp. CX]|uniref:hypothetical protein n=1 Tax=Rhodococcus sp. CX TaxID=2789880 RepID=UPI0018CE6523|nr:hypothetical protein [Rhodococcus sp. CX]MBH0118468.1 hypothetical protein [Rhodococcus sp. CX]
MTTPNHTAADALAMIAVLVRNRIEWATDSIAGNYPMDGETYDDVEARNELPLDALHDLIKDVCEIVAPHTEGVLYSDGRPVQSRVSLPGWSFRHLWPADPTTATEQHIETKCYDARYVVHIVPPSTMTLEPVRTLSVVRENDARE